MPVTTREGHVAGLAGSADDSLSNAYSVQPAR
jgi:hypothetical protein